MEIIYISVINNTVTEQKLTYMLKNMYVVQTVYRQVQQHIVNVVLTLQSQVQYHNVNAPLEKCICEVH
jgi:hypothetical protein